MESRHDGARQRVAHALIISFVGYALLALSALAVTLLVGLATGYFPCVTCFTLPLLTLRLTEIHWTFILLPPVASAFALLLLSKSPLNRRIAAGLALSSPYLLVSLMYVLAGAREFPLDIALLWIAWAFLVGIASAVAVYRLTPSRL